MKIKQIYSKYKIPPNLQLHMMKSAAVGAFIVARWKEKYQLDCDSITKALLFHDTGNIIKFDFKFSQLLGEEEKNIEYWKNVQLDFLKKYGDNEHSATIEIAKEIGIGDKAFKLLMAVGSSKLHLALRSTDWNTKITCYSDFRIDPFGVVSVNKRFDEITARYKGRPHELGNIRQTEKRRQLCLELQKQLQTMVNFDLDKLRNEDIQEYLVKFDRINIP